VKLQINLRKEIAKRIEIIKITIVMIMIVKKMIRIIDIRREEIILISSITVNSSNKIEGKEELKN